MQPTRDESGYWTRGRHYPDHSDAGLYGNGKASEGPADFGQSLWHLTVERLDEAVGESDTSTDVDAAVLLAWRQRDGRRQMIDYVALHPALVLALKLAHFRGAFTKAQWQRAHGIIREAERRRAELLVENSPLAAMERARCGIAERP